MRDWPYYKVSAPNGYTTESWMFMRGTWGEQIHFPLADGVELAARTICYPRKSNGFQSCHLVIDIKNPNSIKIAFKNWDFIARDPSNHKIRYNGIPSRIEQNPGFLVIVRLNSTPKEFELILPNIIIKGKEQSIPPMIFQYEDSFPYQFDPWIGNY
jgi:hypothetical protein